MFEREFASAKAILSGLRNKQPPANRKAEVTAARMALEAQLAGAEDALKQELKISKAAHPAIDAVLAADSGDAAAVKAATDKLSGLLGIVSAADDIAVGKLSAVRANLRFLLLYAPYRGDAAFLEDVAAISAADDDLRRRRMDQLILQLEALAPAINTAAKALKGTVKEWTQVIDGIKKAAQALGIVIQVLAIL